MASDFNKRKKEIKKSIKILRKDIETLTKMAEYVEQNIDTLTEDKADKFDKHLSSLENKLKVVELFG